jgi:hypothetical protein
MWVSAHPDRVDPADVFPFLSLAAAPGVSRTGQAALEL